MTFKSFLGLFAVGIISSTAVAEDGTVSLQSRQTALKAVAEHLQTDYVEAESMGMAAAQSLRADIESGRFEEFDLGDAFAQAVSERLQVLTGDGHLNIEYSVDAGETESAGKDSDEAYAAAQMERWYGAHINYGLQSVQRLENNIGYLDLRAFPPIDMGGDVFAAAMTVVADMDALIIDLRKNGGGIGDMADFVASYLFTPERQPLTGIYDRPTDTLKQSFTHSYVPGKRFGPDKPVYVLTSKRTFSAAEALAYNLQALGRATIIGEVTGGGAHPFDYVRVDSHFVLWSVTAKSVNPLTGSNWQTVGVKPDIAVHSDEALEKALSEARTALAAGI